MAYGLTWYLKWGIENQIKEKKPFIHLQDTSLRSKFNLLDGSI